MIVELIAHSCQLHKEQAFDASDEETADRLIHCANAALPYFSVSFFLPRFLYSIINYNKKIICFILSFRSCQIFGPGQILRTS